MSERRPARVAAPASARGPARRPIASATPPTLAPASRWLLLAFLPGLAWYLWLALHNPVFAFTADDVIYLFMADLYAPWAEAQAVLHQHVRDLAHFPPLFPLLLGLSGGGSDSTLAARAFVACSFALAPLLQHLWLRRMGVPQATALAMALLSLWWPASWILVLDIWSEGLYLCLAWLALCVITKASAGQVRWWWPLCAGFAVACAMATRTIGVALLPALVVAFLPARPTRALWAVLAWAAAYSALELLAVGGGDSYAAVLARSYGAAPLASLLAQLHSALAGLVPAILYDLFLWRSLATWQIALATLLAVGFLWGYGQALRKGEPAAIYCLAYLAVLLIWPFPYLMSRFLFPLAPFVPYYLWRALGRFGQRELAGLLLVVLLAGLAAPAAWQCLSRIATPLPDASLSAWRYTRYWVDASRGGDPMESIATLDGFQRAAHGVGALVPPGDCIYSPQVHLILWQARRLAYLPPAPSVLSGGTALACRYFHATGQEALGAPAFYPLDVLPGLKIVGAWTTRGEDVSDGRGRAGTLLLKRP